MKKANMPEKLIIIAGHYGSGKTNVAVNLALKLKNNGSAVTIIDIDTVNPYFRTADSVKLLNDMGIRCIIPKFANTNVDIPSLPAEIYSTFDLGENEYSVYDAGGDDDGAAVLGMYGEYFEKYGYEMWCVCNMYRPLTGDPQCAADLIRDIEKRSGLKCTGIINNSNLSYETTDEIFKNSFGYINKIKELTNLPIIFHSAFNNILSADNEIFHMQNATKNLYGGNNDEQSDIQ